MKTAEWECTNCGSINRKLVADDIRSVADRCLTCKTKHEVHEGERPVRWTSVAK